ncbi:antitoxin Xre/MbcA/ParS toxin-binding domain-containing protein [Novosphingobium sp.]|uniref:antitoxin Xre/MbcA/ParS toxin-binding domain-containing protein n=1 Tax=Novosphingobium sp. TaxID=1874826 RepID=UPI0031DD9D4D
MTTLVTPQTDRATALSKAVVRIAEFWALSNSKLGAILGLSGLRISRLKRGTSKLDPASKSFEAGQFLLRLFRSLDALLASDDAAARRWLDTVNLDLAAKPIDKLDTMRGLIEVSDYVDFHRARV